MGRYTASTLCGVALSALIGALAGAAEKGTEVIRFSPTLPAGEAKEGTCFAESIAVQRKEAWRCRVGNAIADPCFTVPGAKGTLVCGADPALHQGGFRLKLAGPLPPRRVREPASPEPWLLLLDNGDVCEVSTGTAPPGPGAPARWTCLHPAAKAESAAREAGYLSDVEPGQVWTAQQFELKPSPHAPSGFVRANERRVQVSTAWR